MKRIKILGLFIVLALVLAACAQATPTATSSTAPTTAPVVAPTVAATEAVKQPAELVFGATLPLTGQGAPYGELFKNGLTLGIDQINAAGGIDGIPVKLIITDSIADAAESVTQLTKLVQVNGAIWVSTAFSAPPLAQAPVADQYKVVLTNGGGFAPELRGAGKYLFNDVPLSTDEGKVILTYAYQDLGLRKLGLIIASSYSKATYQFMEDFWKNLGGTVVIEATHDAGATDLRSQLELLKGASPDAVLLLNDGDDTVLTLTQAVQIDFKPQWLGFAGHMIDQIMSLPGAQGMIADSVVYNPSPDFVAAYNAAYGSDPNFYIANYFDQTIMFKDAVEYVIAHNQVVTGENLQAALYAIRTFDGVNGKFTFLDDGTITRDMLVVKVVDSKQTTLKTVTAP